MRSAALAAPLLLAASGCGGTQERPPHATLDDWALFERTAVPLVPRPGVEPYEVIAPLWMDHADKFRFLVLPEGARIGWSDEGIWGLPEGTILVKSFGYRADLRDPASPVRMVETRLLVHEAAGWKPYIYLWNDAQNATERIVAGARVPVRWIGHDGAERALDYRVPNEAHCTGCHGGHGEVRPLGVRTRQMDRARTHDGGEVNQIDRLAALGWFDVPPPPAAGRERMADPASEEPIDVRARSYLDANCAHCHRDGGLGGSTGLWLEWEQDDPYRLGVCRRPIAAGAGTGGRLFDIVPGRPEQSIMIFRMQSDDPGIKMPELPSQLPDELGVRVVSEWIASLEGDCGAP
ncbi:MAG: hypothetical protein NZ898_06190 [Myxococcota bacterium]|nr:hypothetical protein [Myxococcota bacterium]MDW8363371.1 SO2930 family diheme c-type cytochrome [Myxococcales bacterium]